MALTIPSRWKPYRFTGDTGLWKLPGDSFRVPHSVQLKRVEPTQSGEQLASRGVAMIQQVYTAGVEISGPPAVVIEARDKITLEVRRAVSSSGANLKADLAELGSLLMNADYVNNLVDSMIIPCDCADESP